MKTDKMAMRSLIAGMLGTLAGVYMHLAFFSNLHPMMVRDIAIICAIVFSLIGIVLGSISYSQAIQGERKGIAVGGIVTGAIGGILVILLFALIFVIRRIAW